MTTTRHAGRWAIAALAFLVTVWSQLAPLPQLPFLPDEWLRDAFARVQVSSAPEPRVLVVDIDEAALARLGPWPWPRARLAGLVEVLLADYHARGVALDIVLPRPAGGGGDTRLALLAQHGPVVPAQAFDFDLAGNRPAPVRDGQLGGARPDHRGGVTATGFVANYPALARAPHVGAIGFIPDPDGVLRRLPLLTRFEGNSYPALALALADCCAGQRPLAPGAAGDGLVRVPFTRDWSAYTVVSAADIVDHRIDPASAGGRLVLVGSSSLGMGDRVATPLAASRPGVSVHAAMLSALLDRMEGRQPAPWPGKLLACGYALALAVLSALALPRLSAGASVGLLGASAVLWLGLALVASRHDPAFSTAGPLGSHLFLLAVAVPYQWQQAQRRSRHLLQTLRQYVAPAVVEELLHSQVRDPLAPRQLDVTTLVADMEGYTGQVEALPLDEAARLTRAFLDCLTGPVIEHKGTLDKYTGDGMMAFWGAPLPQAEHADLALDAAQAIAQRVRALSRERERAGLRPLRVRIGIDSGPAMAGDFGTSFRSIYTAVGDSVNTAARLEQLAREFPHDVIIGPGSAQRVRRHRLLPLGERLLRGKEKPTPLFTIDQSMIRPDSAAAAPEQASLGTPGPLA